MSNNRRPPSVYAVHNDSKDRKDCIDDKDESAVNWVIAVLEVLAVL